ncbi:MAG: hypothetical protein DDT29_01565 [Dehalococcoidia bacterium]|nr:hypothetical protein [Bacillota bacterium]
MKANKASKRTSLCLSVSVAESSQIFFPFRARLHVLETKVEAATYWTSLSDDPWTVVKLYQAHGTSEQFHSELKADLDLERLPSGKFQTNELVLLLGMVPYNLLRLIGQESLQEADAPIRKQVSRRRVRSVMQDLIYLACRLVRHARRLRLSFGRHCP